MKRLTKKRKKILNDLAWHLIFEWSTYGDEWEYIQGKSAEEKQEVEAALNWFLEYSEK